MVVAGCLAFSGHARADSDRERALTLFEASQVSYRAGAIAKAARALEDAYRLFPEPILLYNLARSREGMGDLRGAVSAYQRYLRAERNVADRGAIVQRVETLSRQIQRSEEERRARAQAEERVHRLLLQPRVRPSTAPWWLAGAGAVVLAGGGVTGFLAQQRHEQAQGAPIHEDAVALQARVWGRGGTVALSPPTCSLPSVARPC